MSDLMQPERFYTPYQRRQVISRISERGGIDIVEASEKFLRLEREDPESLEKLCAKFDADPPKMTAMLTWEQAEEEYKREQAELEAQQEDDDDDDDD